MGRARKIIVPLILGMAFGVACFPDRDRAAGADPDAALTAALRAAVESDHVADALTAIEAGADVDAKLQTVPFEAYWTTPLVTAAARGSLPMAELLLERGADPNLWTHGSGSPLFAALQANALDVAALLVARGARVDGSPSGTRPAFTMLMLAVKERSPEKVRFLIEHGADVNEKNRGGATALMLAAELDFLEAAEGLLAAGADVKARQRSGATALFIAYANLSLEVAGLLLEKGADPDVAKELEGVTLEQAGNIETSRAALTGDDAQLDSPLEGDYYIRGLLSGPRPTTRTIIGRGYTALMWAAMQDSVKATRLLIERGADVDRELHGQTALSLAREARSNDAVAARLRHGAREE
jgi:ankyrin repeat protein